MADNDAVINKRQKFLNCIRVICNESFIHSYPFNRVDKMQMQIDRKITIIIIIIIIIIFAPASTKPQAEN